jgi:hypothetical protein
LLFKRGFVVDDQDAPKVLEWLEDPRGSIKRPVEMTADLKWHFSHAYKEQDSRDVIDSDGSDQEDDLPDA